MADDKLGDDGGQYERFRAAVSREAMRRNEVLPDPALHFTTKLFQSLEAKADRLEDVISGLEARAAEAERQTIADKLKAERLSRRRERLKLTVIDGDGEGGDDNG